MFIRSLASALLLSSALLCGEQADQLYEKGDYSAAVEQYQQMLKSTPKDQQGQLRVKMALAYYRDQEDEKAFNTFLEALDVSPKLTPPMITQEEQRLYDDALKLYLDNRGPSLQDIAQQIKQAYAPVMAQHPTYYQLNFILAAAYANLSMFEEFFNRFYTSYQYYPDSYMAYKTKAILNLKLYEMAPSEMREPLRRKVTLNASKASSKNPQDASLYRILIAFAEPKERQKVTNEVINKLIAGNIVVPRNDILFYVKAAADQGNCDQAEKFLEKVKQWYAYSRSIEVAQEYLMECRNKS